MRRMRYGSMIASALMPTRPMITGIQAAKKTSDLIPLCHPLMLTGVKVELSAEGDDSVHITARCKLSGQTGVEMEALTAASVAALTIYDMCKSVDRAMVIGDVALWEKSGGRSGNYRRPGDATDALDPCDRPLHAADA